MAIFMNYCRTVALNKNQNFDELSIGGIPIVYKPSRDRDMPNRWRKWHLT